MVTLKVYSRMASTSSGNTALSLCVVEECTMSPDAPGPHASRCHYFNDHYHWKRARISRETAVGRLFTDGTGTLIIPLLAQKPRRSAGSVVIPSHLHAIDLERYAISSLVALCRANGWRYEQYLYQ